MAKISGRPQCLAVACAAEVSHDGDVCKRCKARELADHRVEITELTGRLQVVATSLLFTDRRLLRAVVTSLEEDISMTANSQQDAPTNAQCSADCSATLRAERKARRWSERACAELSDALGRIAALIGEPGLEAEPEMLIERLHQRLGLDTKSAAKALDLSPDVYALHKALFLIVSERQRQVDKWGIEQLGFGRAADEPEHALTVIVEEIGEVARAMLDGTDVQVIDELVQVAASACASVEAYIRRDRAEILRALRDEGGPTDDPSPLTRAVGLNPVPATDRDGQIEEGAQ